MISRIDGDFPGGPVVKIAPPNAGNAGLIPGQGAKIPQGSRTKNQNIKQKQYWNKFNKDFKKWSTSKKIFKKKTDEGAEQSRNLHLLTEG